MANRLASVTDWDSNVIAYSYDDANRMTAPGLAPAQVWKRYKRKYRRQKVLDCKTHRVIALVVDAGIVWLAMLLLVGIWDGPGSQLCLGLTYAAYRGGLSGLTGFTVGRRLAGITLLGPSGRPSGWIRSTLREAPIAILLVTPTLLGGRIGLVGLFTVAPLVGLIDLAVCATRPDHRSLRDLVFRTRVERSRVSHGMQTHPDGLGK